MTREPLFQSGTVILRATAEVMGQRIMAQQPMNERLWDELSDEARQTVYDGLKAHVGSLIAERLQQGGLMRMEAVRQVSWAEMAREALEEYDAETDHFYEGGCE